MLETRSDAEGTLTRRRRRCTLCDWRFTTYERADSSEYVVIKSDGKRRERFDIEKVRRGIRAATDHLGIDDRDVENLVNDVLINLRPERLQLRSHDIGEMIEARLKILNSVAFVRFASVFRCFETPSQFRELVATIKPPRVVEKREGRLQPFDPEKIRRGIVWATKHTSLDTAAIEEVANSVVTEVIATGNRIPSITIGESVKRHLQKRDPIAFIRFSSVFDRYDHPDRFSEVAEQFQPGKH